MIPSGAAAGVGGAIVESEGAATDVTTTRKTANPKEPIVRISKQLPDYEVFNRL